MSDLSQLLIIVIDSFRSECFARKFVRAATWCLVCLLCSASSAKDGDAQPDSVELAKMLPPAVNRIVVVQVDDILKSGRAKQEGWAKDAREKFLSGAAVIPP